MNGVQGAIHFVVTGDETDLLRALSSSRSAIIASGDTAETVSYTHLDVYKRQVVHNPKTNFYGHLVDVCKL